MYPKFSVPGVQPEDVWQLFNVGNCKYYKEKIEVLRKKDPKERCSFCTIDPKVNTVLHDNYSWMIWMNKMAPQSGQECQLVIPSKRHIERISEITPIEWDDLQKILSWTRIALGIGDNGVLLVRTGDPARNAKSMPHLHFNFHYPTGKDRVEVTIAKSEEDLTKKLPILEAFEKYRVAEESGRPNPQEVLTEEEWDLIKNRMGPPSTSK